MIEQYETFKNKMTPVKSTGHPTGQLLKHVAFSIFRWSMFLEE
jgi:hypothetical protein